MTEGFVLQSLMLALWWVAWCALHSLMISLWFTELLKRRLGENYRYYRLFYVLVATVTLLPLAVWSRSVKGPDVMLWQGLWRIPQFLLIALSLAIFAAGARRYDLLQLLGIRQIREREAHRALSETGRIDTGGIHGMVRHPWYSGALLLIWARDIDVPVAIVNAVLSLYLVAGTILEERKLVAEFGDKYRAYQREVSMLFPLKWAGSALFRSAGGRGPK